eukprot:CAMPEP_0117776378 /NCGR_PEP_ID=MMETSP0947-20121206/27714_1 /TAXON_ID=44440 /ORGANISM="Chattonella subsalsa, Strain CCMP2191" /LENGTH=403 /DNA_ID=CAMNT_0005603297 /DNA_START=19 /DNA_END=1232 /DNA_ORIENTATION=+
MASSNTLLKMRAMLRSGTVSKPPGWYPIVCQIPPFVRRPAAEAPANIVFPTDRLVKIYEKNPTALKFAARQLEFIESGMSEDKAYRATEKWLAAEEKNSLKELESFTERFQAMGDQPLFSDQKLVDEFQQWKAKLALQPYQKWDYEEVIALDDWMMNSILKWGKKEEFMQNFVTFRRTLFPEIAQVPKELEEYLQQEQQRRTISTMMPLEQIPDYINEYKDLLRKTETTENSPDLLHEAEDWVAKYHSLVPEGSDSIDDKTLMAKLEKVCFQMFPALDAQEDEEGEIIVPLSRVYSMEEYEQLSEDIFSQFVIIKDSNGNNICAMADFMDLEGDTKDSEDFSDTEEAEEEEEPIMLPTFERHMKEQEMAMAEAKWRMENMQEEKGEGGLKKQGLLDSNRAVPS